MNPQYVLNATINIFHLYEILHAIQSGASGIGELVVKKDTDPINSSLGNALEEFRSLRDKQERFEEAITNGNLILYPAANLQEEINLILDDTTTFEHLKIRSCTNNILLAVDMVKEICVDYKKPALLVLVDLSVLKSCTGNFAFNELNSLSPELTTSKRLSEGIIEVLCINYNQSTKKIKFSPIPLWV